jgi:hypothetical protein
MSHRMVHRSAYHVSGALPCVAWLCATAPSWLAWPGASCSTWALSTHHVCTVGACWCCCMGWLTAGCCMAGPGRAVVVPGSNCLPARRAGGCPRLRPLTVGVLLSVLVCWGGPGALYGAHFHTQPRRPMQLHARLQPTHQPDRHQTWSVYSAHDCSPPHRVWWPELTGNTANPHRQPGSPKGVTRD